MKRGDTGTSTTGVSPPKQLNHGKEDDGRSGFVTVSEGRRTSEKRKDTTSPTEDVYSLRIDSLRVQPYSSYSENKPVPLPKGTTVN